MRLTYKAHRLVAAALRDQPTGPDGAQLGSWLDRGPDADLPPHIATLVLAVLDTAERDMRCRLERVALDEDRRADLINDIRYAMSVKATLRRELAERQAA